MSIARYLSKFALGVNSQGVLNAAKGGTGSTSGANSVTVYATAAALPVSGVTAGAQAYVTATNRLYLWTGTGWYNIALINQAPTITSGAAATYNLAQNGTPTVVTLQATDPEGVNISWSYEITSGSLGSIATITQNNNVFTITPTTDGVSQGSFEVTFKATDGVNIATSVSVFSLAFVTARYANFGNTTSVANAGTGIGITSATNFNTSKSFFSGAYPMRFTESAVPTLVTTINGAVTLEFWCYLDSPTGYWKDFGVISSAGDTTGWKRGMWTTSNTSFGLKNGTNYYSENTANIIGNWFHIAMCCDTNGCRYFKNGQLINNANVSPNPLSPMPAGNITIEMPTHPGYYQDIQVHGEVKYTTNFAPTARKLV